MSDPEREFPVPADIAKHPAWARLEGQRGYYDSKAGVYQKQYKHIKLTLIALSAGIPLIVFLPGEVFKYVVAAAGVVIAMLEGLLLLNQYGPLWVKYRSTAEGLNRERWLLLARAGDYADKPDDEALRQLADRVEGLLEAERKEWSSAQNKMLEDLAKTQQWVQAQMDETARRASQRPAEKPAALAGAAPAEAPIPAPAPIAEPSLAPGPTGEGEGGGEGDSGAPKPP